MPFLFTVGSWFHNLIREPCFDLQGEASGVLTGEASAIKAIAKVAATLRIAGVVASVDAVLIIAYEDDAVKEA